MIDKNIAALLYRFQCVTVPGFGAFITEIQSARVSGSASSFNPPRKIITFNSNVKNNDGLLANHIALEEGISFEVATEKIANEVSNWLIQIENKDKVVLKNIGEISINSNSFLVFEPYYTENYLTYSFGLTSFTSPIISREELKKQVEELEAKAPIIFTPERKNNYSYIKYAASIVLFISAGTFGYKTYNDQQVSAQKLYVEKKVQERINNKIQEATFFITSPVISENILNTEEQSKPYHIIASAFRNEENARTEMNNLIKLGYNATLLEINNSGLIPVAFGSYTTLEEAQLEKEKIQTKHNTEAWLLID